MIPVTILQLLNNFKPVIILKLGGRRRPGLYADIQLPILQVPAGEEGGTGGLPKLLKEDEKKEDEKVKKEDGDYEEEKERKWREEEDMQDRLVVEDGMIIKFPLVP